MKAIANSRPHNADIGDAFDEMAELLAIRGDNPFRVRAYQRAAQVIRTLPQPLKELRTTMSFDDLPGIGPDLAKKIEEYLRTGKLRALDRLRQEIPEGLRDLLRLPALGPVRVRALYAKLGVQDIDDLRQALSRGRLEELKGFGPGIRATLQKAVASEQSAAPG
jgi:DNA polymerase (family X)